MDFWAPLETEDPEIASLVRREEERTRSNLELIASESYPSLAVLQAVGSVLTAKYAEGYPGRRYYGGCEVVDEIEQLAIDRAKQLFGAEHANVQPHAGAPPNMAVYLPPLVVAKVLVTFAGRGTVADLDVTDFLPYIALFALACLLTPAREGGRAGTLAWILWPHLTARVLLAAGLALALLFFWVWRAQVSSLWLDLSGHS